MIFAYAFINQFSVIATLLLLIFIIDSHSHSRIYSTRLQSSALIPSLAGRTLADYLSAQGRILTVDNGVEALIELQLKGGFIGIFHAMDEGDVERVMRHPDAMFETDGDLVELGKGFPHPRSLGSFPRILGRYVRERKVLTLEQAVFKMTGQPAAFWGQADRGGIAPGKKADIVLLVIRSTNKATYR